MRHFVEPVDGDVGLLLVAGTDEENALAQDRLRCPEHCVR